MYKLIVLAIIALGIVLYISGGLEFDSSGDNVNISIDKEKAEELGQSIKDKLEK